MYARKQVSAALLLGIAGTVAPMGVAQAAFDYAINNGINYQLANTGKYDFQAETLSAASLGLGGAGDMATVSGTILHGGVSSPNTRINAYTQGGLPINGDGDGEAQGSPFGTIIDQAGALSSFPVNGDGSIRIKVTGDSNTAFGSSAHGETGFYDLYVDIFDAGGGFIQRQSFVGNDLPAAGVQSFDMTDPGGGAAWASFDAFTVNGNPIDFWVFTGLAPGSTLSAAITSSALSGGGESGLDAIGIGWANPATGEALAWDQKTATVDGVELTGLTASGDGKLVVAVSDFGGGDFIGGTGRFAGAQNASGAYDLKLTLNEVPAAVPVPAALPLLASALAGLGFAGWRRRD